MYTCIAFISTIISFMALTISVFASREQDCLRETYSYETESDIPLPYIMEYQLKEGKWFPDIGLGQACTDILEKSNLDEVYAISAENEVERLELENVEDYFEIEGLRKVNEEKADLVIGMFKYCYQYILLKNSDGEYILYLVYLKSWGEKAILGIASGMKVYELQYGHKKDEEMYEGERIMAEQYHKILQYIKEWIY